MAKKGSETSQIVAFTSGKGGCGKTTLAVNFAYTIYQTTGKVLVIDFDMSNRGSTGLFSEWTPDEDHITLSKIIRNQHKKDDQLLPTLEIKPGYYFIPAIAPNEINWEDPHDVGLQDFTSDLKKKILELASDLDIPCIVLDCFCGVDLLTTSGASVADDTIIVNEPDIVTFTGSIVLLKHLKKSFKELEVEPKIRFVINRVRAYQTVKELTLLYRDNLQSEIEDSVLAHFPYNDRIFQHFGKYPFMTELLPNSLFSKKFELLSRLLFEEKRPELIKPKVRKWSNKKIKSIYLKSIDKSSVDSQYLIYKATSFPVFIGILFLLFLVSFRTFSVSPFFVWFAALLLVSGFVFLFASRILHSIWLSVRLNFTQSLFDFRLGRRIGEHARYKKGIISALAGSMMGVTVFVLGGLLAIISYLFITEMFDKTPTTRNFEYNYSYFPQFKDSLIYEGALMDNYPRGLADAMNRVSLRMPVRELDLSNHQVHKEYFFDSFNQSRQRSINVFEPGEITISNTTFIHCEMPRNLLQSASKLQGISFDYCSFPTDSTLLSLISSDMSDLVRTRQNFYLLEETIRSLMSDIVVVSNSDLNHFIIKGLPNRFGLMIQNSELDNIELELNQNQSIAYLDNIIRETITVSNLDSTSGNPVYFYHLVDDDDLSSIYFQEGVKAVPILNKSLLIEALIDKYLVEYMIYLVHQDLSYYQNEYLQYRDSTDLDYVNLVKEGVIIESLNLIELYLLTENENHYKRASNLIQEARNLVDNLMDSGILTMLNLKLAILSGEEDEINEQFDHWSEWLESQQSPQQINREVSGGYFGSREWSFQLFNRNLRYLSSQLTMDQIEKLLLVVTSAMGQIEPATFKTDFVKDYSIPDEESNVKNKMNITTDFYNMHRASLVDQTILRR